MNRDEERRAAALRQNLRRRKEQAGDRAAALAEERPEHMTMKATTKVRKGTLNAFWV